MRRLMEYKIISGRTVEIRRTMMEIGSRYPKVRRGTKCRRKSTLRQMQANEREAVKSLARILNCNFKAGDLWLTLKYPENALPENVEAAEKEFQKLLRKLKDIHKKETGKTLRYVYTTSDKDSSSDKTVRIHHHIVMDPVGYELICRYWPAEYITYRRMDGRGDYTGIARYMVQNVRHEEGKRRWKTSRGNLEKPVYTMPVPVNQTERVRIPRDASLKEKNEFEDEETMSYSLYVRYTKAVMRE